VHAAWYRCFRTEHARRVDQGRRFVCSGVCLHACGGIPRRRKHEEKIQGPIGWHTLGHSYRAWLDETGAFLGVQQKLMHHANISTTMNVYGGAFMEQKRKANRSVVQRVMLQDRAK
jgi:integrase